jgi:hypothetical protein
MRPLRYALWPAGLAFGVAAEWIGRPDLLALDAITGFTLVGLGLTAWSRRPQSRAGLIIAAAGFAWLLGSVWSWAVYLNRGPLAHLLLSYPTGRISSSRLDRGAVVAAYAYAAVYPVAGNDYATIAFALALVALAMQRYFVSGGPERRARFAALATATTFGLVLALDATARLADVGASRAALWAYDLVVCLVAVALFADLLWGRWTQATVAGLVVDLGQPAAAGTLRDRLARALGDPTLEVGYWLPEQNRYVDEAGRPVEFPAAGAERAITPIEEDGQPVAALVHDRAVLDDPALVSAVASAMRLVVANERLQAEVRERVTEVVASRRRIVEAADEQHRRLELELREGAERRLTRVAELVSDVDPELERQLVEAQAELSEFARGIHPPALTERGLRAALVELAARCPIRVDVDAAADRFPQPVEAAAYFVCSEALTNISKYAEADRAAIRVFGGNGRLTVEVADDGVGGANPALGSGIRGLADRVEALGGRLSVTSPPGGGTRVVAELPSD